MAHEFCDHLDEYGVQYTRTEASYRQCVNLLERIMADDRPLELTGLVATAVLDWTAEDERLREMLVEQVGAGKVRVPSHIVKHFDAGAYQTLRVTPKSEHPICADCGFSVPRLAYPEWKLAANGEASFQGQDLVLSDPLPV